MTTFDLIAHLRRARGFSERTFGPGERTVGIVDHIIDELGEVLADPTDLTEWIDVVILALDGAWRVGYSAEQIVEALEAKQTKNEGRTWPDWRTAEPGKAIKHVRDRAHSEMLTLQTELAYSAARSDVECYCIRADADRWHDLNSIIGAEEREEVDRAIRYLELRGLLERHPTQPWVRVRDEDDVAGGRG